MAINSPTTAEVLPRAQDDLPARHDRTPRHNPLFQFVRECRIELRKVVWPTRQEATRLTLIVIGVSTGVGLILGGFDYAIGQLFSLVAH
ncbi:MAG: preprotein translocase subunit SecE [Chloroflexi bacterium]|nr:preprotein translocase subunit SecE [Chloroflexota bacterium]